MNSLFFRFFIIFNSFCGNDKFLLLCTVLRNLDNKQGILSKSRLWDPLELPHIAYKITKTTEQILPFKLVYRITNWTV